MKNKMIMQAVAWVHQLQVIQARLVLHFFVINNYGSKQHRRHCTDKAGWRRKHDKHDKDAKHRKRKKRSNVYRHKHKEKQESASNSRWNLKQHASCVHTQIGDTIMIEMAGQKEIAIVSSSSVSESASSPSNQGAAITNYDAKVRNGTALGDAIILFRLLLILSMLKIEKMKS